MIADIVEWILTWILNAVSGTYRNDKIAFFTGIGMIAVTAIVPFRVMFSGWIILAYFVTLYFAARKGEKIELEKSFVRAVRTAKTQNVQTPQQAQPQQAQETPLQQEKPPEPVPPPAQQPQEPQVPQPVPPPAPQQEKKHPVVQFVGEFLSEEDRQAQDAMDIAEVEKTLRSRIKGQDHAIVAVVNALKRIVAGLRTRKEKPQGVFLFLGATGTGKTELVKQIAAAMKRPLVRLDMPNYSSEASVWELIGSPPGYAGSDRPGRLTGEIRDNPDAVLLLDEIEKATPKIWDPFLRVLDEGKMKDQSQGFTANFSNVLIFLTSNLMQFEDVITDEKELRNKVLREGYFRPELLNRIDCIVQFRQFTPAIMKEIVLNMVSNYIQGFLEANKMNASVHIDVSVIEHVIKNIDIKYGVRDAQRYVDRTLGDALADAYIQRKGTVTSITVRVQDEKIVVDLS